MLPSLSVTSTPNCLKLAEASPILSASSATPCLKPRPAIPASKALLVKICRAPNSWSIDCPVVVKKGRANLTALAKYSYYIRDFCIANANLSATSPA